MFMALPIVALPPLWHCFRALGFAQADLEAVAADGKAPVTFHIFFQDMARKWPTNTQDVEGVNSVLKKTTRSAPNVGLGLLSSRTLIKRMMPLISEVDGDSESTAPACRRARWNAQDAFVASCCERHRAHGARIEAVIHNLQRWTEFDPNDQPLDHTAPSIKPRAPPKATDVRSLSLSLSIFVLCLCCFTLSCRRLQLLVAWLQKKRRPRMSGMQSCLQQR